MSTLAEIEKLLDAKFRHSRSGMNTLLQREHQLRDGLSKLVEMENHYHENGYDEMRAIGADVVWRSWVGRSKMRLNLELAQILAQKEVVMRGVRKDFGKLVVCQNLKQNKQDSSNTAKQKKALAVAIEAHLLSNGRK